MNWIVGAEVTDTAGATLGKVTKEGSDWILVEKSGPLQQSRVVMQDEIATIDRPGPAPRHPGGDGTASG